MRFVLTAHLMTLRKIGAADDVIRRHETLLRTYGGDPDHEPAPENGPTIGRRAVPPFTTMSLPAAPDVVAPDGSDVRVLLSLHGGSMAHFELAAGRTSTAVRHRTVEEIWYVLSGTGRMWRSGPDGREEVVDLHTGVCLTIPVGTAFQFRADGDSPLAAVGVTMPPWPGVDEAEPVPGRWPADA